MPSTKGVRAGNSHQLRNVQGIRLSGPGGRSQLVCPHKRELERRSNAMPMIPLPKAPGQMCELELLREDLLCSQLSGPLNRLNAILSLLQPLDRYRTPSAIGSAIGRPLSRPISHPNTGGSLQPPRSKPLGGLNRVLDRD